MKLKIINIIFGILALTITVTETIIYVQNCLNDALVFYIVGIVCLLFSILGLLFPKTTFDICFRLFCGDNNYDYEKSYHTMPKVILGLSISCICFQIIALLVTIL